MSLDFHYGDIKNCEIITTHPDDLDKEKSEQRYHPVTDTIIWKMMAIGCTNITEKNVDEVWWRTRFLQVIDGPELLSPNGGIYLTKKDIQNHINLSTNVSQISRNEFVKRVLENKNRIFEIESKNPDGKSAFEVCQELHEASKNKN